MPDRMKKQVPLRITGGLYDDLNKWAEDDFRSLNGQIEYLLSLCVKQKKKNGGFVPDLKDTSEKN